LLWTDLAHGTLLTPCLSALHIRHGSMELKEEKLFWTMKFVSFGIDLFPLRLYP
jgi:hypothetical protein